MNAVAEATNKAWPQLMQTRLLVTRALSPIKGVGYGTSWV